MKAIGGIGLAATVALTLSAYTRVTVAQGTTSAVDSTQPKPVVDATWLKVTHKGKRAEFQLIAGLTGLNGALNFNGFRDGGLTLAVPKGWHVALYFRNNDGMMPHSAEVIPDAATLPAGPVPPAFDRAFSARLAEGIAPQGTDSVTFVADKPGSYIIDCAVPGHATQGMWIRFSVAEKGRLVEPKMVVTPGP